MKFTCTVDIAAPLEHVISLFDDTANLAKWQDGFVSYTLTSGNRGEEGSTAQLVYLQGNRRIELLETIEIKDLPKMMQGRYEHKNMCNTMTNRFESLDEKNTRWTADLDYYKVNGIFPRLLAFFAPSIFKKQTQKWLDRFKAFVENDTG